VSKAKIHPVACPCGWTTSNARYSSEADKRVAQHQTSRACKLNPRYLPPAERRRLQTEKARAAWESRPPATCTIAEGACDCDDCTHAQVDGDSPLNLTNGRWVNRRGVRVWVRDGAA
jgi:hypothetical protein